jgi:hypothetical protein
MFEHILLEPVQAELLAKIVEAARNVPVEQRERFVVAQNKSGDTLIHPGLPEKNKRIYYGDVEMLAQAGLLNLGFGSRGTPLFDVTPLGFRYYEYLKKRAGEAIDRVESTIRNYLDAHEFKQKYPEAFEKWSSAEDLLWCTDTEQQLTTIGHLCREAVQEFATALVECFQPPDVTNDKTKTVDRLRAVLDLKRSELGTTERPFLDALLAYWGTVNDLIQRQEHGAQRESQQLVWEDARRVVFQTMIIMFEIDRAL